MAENNGEGGNKLKRRWKTLIHNGPYITPPYKKLPSDVNFLYDGQKVPLELESEEIAGFYAKKMHRKCAKSKKFKENFFNEWRNKMTEDERSKISDLKKCDFKELHVYYKKQTTNKEEERRKEIYRFCHIDGKKQMIRNFQMEPPGLFEGRGNNPKSGKIKKRIERENVIINCSDENQLENYNEWKAIECNKQCMWLAKWKNINDKYSYMKLDPSSKLRVEREKEKYKTALNLNKGIDELRTAYFKDIKSGNSKEKQRGVALYLIDHLALRKGTDSESETYGCCTLLKEHITLPEENVVAFDFKGKDSVPYYNKVSVDPAVFKILQDIKVAESTTEKLFNDLKPTDLNTYLSDKVEGLTAKVLRTHNASVIFEKLLKAFTKPNETTENNFFRYANLAVAIYLNHRKNFDQRNENEEEVALKIKKNICAQIQEKVNKWFRNKEEVDKLLNYLKKLSGFETTTISLDSSKENYIDPRIAVAWCKLHNIKIETIFSKNQRKKFAWAIEAIENESDFKFSI